MSPARCGGYETRWVGAWSPNRPRPGTSATASPRPTGGRWWTRPTRCARSCGAAGPGSARPRGGLDSDNQVGRVLRRRTMKIGVVGATGRTGRQVAEQALARGDDVIALARHPEALPRLGPG